MTEQPANAAEQIVPILRTGDATRAMEWYRRLGFAHQFTHRFGPGMPAFVGLVRNGVRLYLSEHAGDAVPNGLVYLWVADVRSLAAALHQAVEQQPWALEIAVRDPDGNRIRIGQARPAAEA